MSRIPTFSVAVAVAITAPVAALAAVAIQRAAHHKPRAALVADYGIRNVPDRPPLWRAPAAPPSGAPRPADAAPVPPENPHAPPAPPNGTGQVR